jgi:hypothetical protein
VGLRGAAPFEEVPTKKDFCPGRNQPRDFDEISSVSFSVSDCSARVTDFRMKKQSVVAD